MDFPATSENEAVSPICDTGWQERFHKKNHDIFFPEKKSQQDFSSWIYIFSHGYTFILLIFWTPRWDESLHYFLTVSSCFRKPVPGITYLQKNLPRRLFFSKRDLHSSRGKREENPGAAAAAAKPKLGTRGAEEEKRKITLPRTVAFAQLFKKTKDCS